MKNFGGYHYYISIMGRRRRKKSYVRIISITFTDEEIKEMDRKRGNMSRGQFLAYLLEKEKEDD